MLINVTGSELGDKSNVKYNWGSQKIRLVKRGPRSSKLTKKGSARQKFGDLCSKVFQNNFVCQNDVIMLLGKILINIPGLQLYSIFLVVLLANDYF